MEEVILSIFVPTFNHEKYISQALDSILMQKTEYKFEVLVGEDCSKDGTREILQQYEEKYPNIFKMFYRDTNMYNQNPTNAGDLKLRCKGKYMICLEGDDYWTDEYKIDKQIRFLEEHPEYYGVAHNCVVVDQESKPNGEKYPECKDNEYTFKHFVSEIMPGQLATFMHRNCYMDTDFNSELFFKGLVPGDRLLYYAIATHGKIYCIQEEMSAYRHVKKEGTSFSATYEYNFNKSKVWHEELLKYIENTDNKQAKKYVRLLYFKCLMQGFKAGKYSLKQVIKSTKDIGRVKTITLYMKYMIRKNILHKKIWV